MITTPAQRSSVMKTGPTSMTSNNFLQKKKKGRGNQYLVKWKNYARFIWETASVMENTVVLDEFETNLYRKGVNVMGRTHMVVGLVVGLEKVGLISAYWSTR